MTTACGSTTSSPDTPSTPKRPLEEAPFSIYLEILRDNGYAQEADESELFYTELLMIPFEDGSSYTREQIYNTPFRNLVLASEKLIGAAYAQVNKVATPLTSNGPVLAGAGADKFTPEQIRYLMMRQLEETEKEKQRLNLR